MRHNIFIYIVFLLLLFVCIKSDDAYAKTKVRLANVGYLKKNEILQNSFSQSIQDFLKSQKNLSLADDLRTEKTIQEKLKEDSLVLQQRIKEAQEAFVLGKKAFDQLNVQEAVKHFTVSVAGFREGIALLRSNRYLLLSHLYLGIALYVLDRKVQGEKMIREMVILDMARERRNLSSKEFSPNIVTLHQKITKEVLLFPKGKMVFSIEPKQAKVYIDGLEQKMGPEQSIEVPVGEHFIVIEQDGYKPFAQGRLIGPGENRVDVELEEFRPFSPFEFAKRNNFVAVDELKQAARELSSNVLLLGEFFQNQDAWVAKAQLYDARSNEFSKIMEVNFEERSIAKQSKSLGKKIMNQLSNQGFVLADVNLKENEQSLKQHLDGSGSSVSSTGRRPFYKKSWFWYSLGAVAVLGGSYYLLKDSLGQKNYNVLKVVPLQ